jgi:hypothetical protein
MNLTCMFWSHKPSSETSEQQFLDDKFLCLYYVIHESATKAFIDFKSCALFRNIKITTTLGALSDAAR